MEDLNDSSPLLLGLALGALMQSQPHLKAAGVAFENIVPVSDEDGTVKALRFIMGSGSYLLHVHREFAEQDMAAYVRNIMDLAKQEHEVR